MNTLDWNTIRTKAIRAFQNELPRPDTEQRIIETFQHNPHLVITLIDQTTEAVATGRARSGWAILRHQIEQADNPPANPTVNLDNRENNLRKAENWIRNAGHYCDLYRDIEEELFGKGGPLHTWKDDPQLNDRIHRLWQQQRPRGEQAEHEHEAYMTKIREQRETAKNPQQTSHDKEAA